MDCHAPIVIKTSGKSSFAGLTISVCSRPTGRQRLLYQLAGVVPSPLLLELLSCPLCTHSLETLELELGDLEGGRGEADGLREFPQVIMHGRMHLQ